MSQDATPTNSSEQMNSTNKNDINNGLVLDLNEVTKTYSDGTIGIDDLTLQVNKGEIFGFLGQNGAGKTTTIRCILNILIPENGTIKVNGETVSRNNPEIRENIGYLPGELNVPAYYKVEDFLHYIASLRKTPSNRMQEIIDLFELPVDKKVNALSKGNKQKVGLVLAFMSDPDVLILDEPSSGLDPIYQQILYNLILEEKEKGKTVFFSSHNLDEVQKICDRVGIIREGKLVAIEKVKGLSEKIPRMITATINNLSEDTVKQLSEIFDVANVSYQLEEVSMIATTMGDVNKIMNHVLAMDGVRDIAYPPASLEIYFMRKYKED